MKKALFGVGVFLLTTGIANCQPPAIEMTLTFDRPSFAINDEVVFHLAVKNLSASEALPILPLTDWVLVLDGRQHQREVMGWGGPSSIPPRGDIRLAVALGAYGIAREQLTKGQHAIAVQWHEMTSNAVVFNCNSVECTLQ